MKTIFSTFEQATVSAKGNNLTKSLPSAVVTIVKKGIYIGVKCNWVIKWKDITKLEVEGMSVFLETDGQTVGLVNADQGTWFQFSEVVEKRWINRQDKIAAAEELAKPAVITKTKARGKPSRVYGKKARSHARILASAVANSRLDNWSDMEEVEKEDHHAPALPDEEAEEEEAQFMDENEPSDDEATLEMSEEDDVASPPPRATCGRKGRQKIIVDDSDEEVFDDAEMTAPGYSRLVTPRAATAFVNNEESKEEQKATVETDVLKNQLNINSFFNAKPTSKVSLSLAAKPPTTPKRKIKPSSPIEITTPLNEGNEKWIEAVQRLTPIKTLQQRAPHTPAKTTTPRRLPTSRNFSSKRSAEDIEDPDGTSDKKARGKYFMSRKSSTADLSITSATSPRNPYPLKFPKSTPKSTPPSPLLVSEVSHWKGLRNLGNTCYLNSSLQMLYTVQDFCTRLVNHGGPLSRSVRAVDQFLQQEKAVSSVSPRLVKDAIDIATDRFSGYEQRDAHEFLSDLIDRVHDELEEEVDAGKENKESTNNTKDEDAEWRNTVPSLLTDEFFRMNVNVCLKCDSCSYERNMDEMYRHLSIEVDRHEQRDDDVRPKWTVNEGLQKFFQSDQRELMCEKCEEGTTATQTLSVKSRPKALILQLKRFVVKERTRTQRPSIRNSASENDEFDPKHAEGLLPPVEMVLLKNKDPVVVNESVDLDHYLPKELKGSKYKLSGIVHHHGGSPSSGHYTTDAVRVNSDSKNVWVSFDDGSAYEANIAKILRSPHSQRTAYLLLYTLDS